MVRNFYFDKDGISAAKVVSIFVVIIIFVVLGMFGYAYNQEFSSNGGPCIACNGTFIASTFSNPYDGNGTDNNGGWKVKVTALSGGNPDWNKVTVTLKGPNIESEMKGVGSTKADLWRKGDTDVPKWYLRQTEQPYFMDDGNRTTLGKINAAGLDVPEYDTLENVVFIVIDEDGNNTITVGDYILVFKDNDGDGVDDVTPGSRLEFAGKTGSIGAAPLN